jgi:hypothetical protein
MVNAFAAGNPIRQGAIAMGLLPAPIESEADRVEDWWAAFWSGWLKGYRQMDKAICAPPARVLRACKLADERLIEAHERVAATIATQITGWLDGRGFGGHRVPGSSSRLY